MAVGTLHFFCGKMGAGKSTSAKALASENKGVLISEDEWLGVLFGDQISTLDDYVEYSSRLKPLLAGHVKDLLLSGVNVVLDFPANTLKQRKWLSDLGKAAGITGRLVYIKASDEICLEQIAIRQTEQPERAKFDTEEVFRKVTKHFQEPTEDEGFIIQEINRNGR